MFKKLKNRFPGKSPSVILVVILVAILGASGLALMFSKSDTREEAELEPMAARIERVDGEVGVVHAFDEDSENQQGFEEAVVNTPLSVGDRIYAPEGSSAAVAFTGRNRARLDSGTSLDVLTLADNRTQLALRDGSALFDVGYLDDGDLFEVATPNGAVDFYEPGLYQVGIGNDGNTLISVLSGLAQVVGLAGSGRVSKGEVLTLVGQAAAQLVASRLAPELAGGIVDDYYGYRYGDRYDGRYRNYDAYLDDPYYYDPYRDSTSYQYISYDVPGAYDLDYYGDWIDDSDYGRCWSPRVDSDWAPYRSGYWDSNNIWGPTWVSQEPWGWAPYHYGRWAYVNNSRWVWVPENVRVRNRPVYAPACVAFVPVTQYQQIAWVPLAPGEPYVPRYYDADYQPRYLASDRVVNQYIEIQQAFINTRAPRAITAVPYSDFTEVIGPARYRQVDPQLIARSRVAIDPFAIDDLRQAARREKHDRKSFKLSRQMRERIFDRQVVASATPVVPHLRSDLAKRMRVEAVSNKQRKQKLKIERSGEVVNAEALNKKAGRQAVRAARQEHLSKQGGQSVEAIQRKRQIDEFRAKAAKGDQNARNEMKRLKREQRAYRKATRSGAQTHSTEYLGPPARENSETRTQRKARKQIERRQSRPESVQQQTVRQPAQKQLREQRKAEKKAMRQQRQQQQLQQRQQRQQPSVVQRKQPAAVQQTVKAPNPRKAERQAARQAAKQQRAMREQNITRQQVRKSQPARQAESSTPQVNQRKAERQAARQVNQGKAERKAARQQRKANKRDH